MAPILQKMIIHQISNNSTPKVWISAFLGIDRSGKLVSAIMKKWKMNPISQKIGIEQNFQLLTPSHPPKLRSPLFSVSMETKNWCWPLWKHETMGDIFVQNCHFQLLTTPSPKVSVSAFLSVDGNGELCWPLWKNGSHFMES